MKKLFVFLGIVFMAIGSAASAQEVESMVPMQKSSWGDAKTSEFADYIPEISLDMRGSFRIDSESEIITLIRSVISKPPSLRMF